MYKQEEQNAAIRQQSQGQLAAGEAAQQRQADINAALASQNIGLQRQQMREQAAELKRSWKWKEEERDWNRARDFADRLTDMVSKTPDLQDRLVNIWRQRGA